MAYVSTVNGQSYRVEQQEQNEQQLVNLEGTPHTLNWQRIASLAPMPGQDGTNSAGGHYSLLIEGRSYDVFARVISKPGDKTGQTYEIFLEGQRFEVRVEDERTRLLAGLSGTAVNSGEAQVTAPMPGLVVNIPVEPGESVTEGQTVAILEAMKMENDLPSPIDGVITEVKVQKGQTVDQGDVLVVVKNESA